VTLGLKLDNVLSDDDMPWYFCFSFVSVGGTLAEGKKHSPNLFRYIIYGAAMLLVVIISISTIMNALSW